MQEERIIGERTGERHGALLLIFAQMHGNEPAGSIASQWLFEAIDAEYQRNPSFSFNGKIVALRGNLRAVRQKARYIHKDLNRSWTPENVERIAQAESDELLDSEDLEIREILALVRTYIADYQPTNVVVLDLHTTTAHGGIFTIPAKDEYSRYLALSMHAPVIHGFLKGLSGTSLHYFRPENFGVEITPVCFEAGQHESPDSPRLALSAIINCFRAMGGFSDKDVEIKHHLLLQERAKNLPRESRLIYTHHIKQGDDFQMRTDRIYQNFDKIEQGELLAYDKNGAIAAPRTGHILMPLYQRLGSDGFFIIEEIDAKLQFKPTKQPLAAQR